MDRRITLEIRKAQKALTSTNQQERDAAMGRLGELCSQGGDRAISTALRSKSREMRRRVAECLFMLTAPKLNLTETEEALVHLLQNEKAPATRGAAAAALSRIGELAGHYHIATVDALVRALHDEAAPVRMFSAHALGYAVYPHVERLLFPLLDDPNEMVRDAAIGRLAKIRGCRSLQPLVRALKRPEANTRRSVLDALGHMGTRAAARHVSPLLQDRVPCCRASAVIALAKIGDCTAAVRITALADDADHTVRRAVAESLGTLRVPGTVKTLKKLLDDADESVAREALGALAGVGGRQASRILFNMAARHDSPHRKQLAMALGRLGDRRGIPFLVDMLDDRRVRTEAALSLVTLGPPEGRREQVERLCRACAPPEERLLEAVCGSIDE